jgi:hypothetical protein
LTNKEKDKIIIAKAKLDKRSKDLREKYERKKALLALKYQRLQLDCDHPRIDSDGDCRMPSSWCAICGKSM